MRPLLLHLAYTAIPCDCPDHRLGLGTFPSRRLRRLVARRLLLLAGYPASSTHLRTPLR